jgi:hypothetical protein
MLMGVRDYDRVLLICSQSSLTRPGVLNEIEQVLVREGEEGGSEILIPITIDDYVFEEWKPEREDIARQIRARVILNFRGATSAGAEFEERYKRLLDALEVVDSEA